MNEFVILGIVFMMVVAAIVVIVRRSRRRDFDKFVASSEPAGQEPDKSSRKVNYSAASLRSTTTVLIALAIILGIIGLGISANAHDLNQASLGASIATLSNLLLVSGILGKLLLAASRVIVEGLGGNIKEH